MIIRFHLIEGSILIREHTKQYWYVFLSLVYLSIITTQENNIDFCVTQKIILKNDF